MQKVELFVVAFLPDALQHYHVERVGIADRSARRRAFGQVASSFAEVLGIATGE